MADLPPGVKRSFGFNAISCSAPRLFDKKEGGIDVASGEVEGSVGVDKHGAPRLGTSAYKGIDTSLGLIKLSSGEDVDEGRLVMRGTWNTDLYLPLREL